MGLKAAAKALFETDVPKPENPEEQEAFADFLAALAGGNGKVTREIARGWRKGPTPAV